MLHRVLILVVQLMFHWSLDPDLAAVKHPQSAGYSRQLQEGTRLRLHLLRRGPSDHLPGPPQQRLDEGLRDLVGRALCHLKQSADLLVRTRVAQVPAGGSHFTRQIWRA